jgi:hypothetical protein
MVRAQLRSSFLFSILAMLALAAAAWGGRASASATPGGGAAAGGVAQERGAAAPNGGQSAAGRGPVVVELFTSQGCSSCPPADRLLSRLQRDPQVGGVVIPLAFHVDYWNHLGWSDPFSSPLWSRRQESYAHAFRTNRIYTPQLVIGGRTQCVGSEEREVMRRIHDALAAEPAAEVSLAAPAGEASPSTGGAGTGGGAGAGAGGVAANGGGAGAAGGARVAVSARLLRPPAGAGSLDLWVALTESGLKTAVGAGENAKATLHDDHVVRRLVKAFTLPSAAGAASSAEVVLPLDRAWNPATLEIVAFLQDPRSLAIHGAASRPLAALAR